MTKIDLTGNSGWQSKSGDRLKEIQKGEYEHDTIELIPENILTDWIEAGIMVQLEEGGLILKIKGEQIEYEEGEFIVFNEENSVDAEIIISEKVNLQIFKPK